MRFAREALPFVLPLLALGLAGAFLGWKRAAFGLLVAALGVLLFFRIPHRSATAAPGVVLAPANGVITKIDRAEEASLGAEPAQRIAIFLSVFDVHVQRAPVGGRVVESTYTPGRKVAAFRADAGEVNENHWTVIVDAAGRKFGVRQIAGLLARRVVTYLETGRAVERGELIGLIKFGSRVDLYVPADYRLEVRPGQKMIDGETVMARPADRPGE